jgi:geranylgeranyl pyrophosphate synthase
VADDVLDVTADEAKLGKPVGADVQQGKTTYADRLGLDGARAFARQLLDEALAAIASFDAQADHLRGLARFIVERAY